MHISFNCMLFSVSYFWNDEWPQTACSCMTCLCCYSTLWDLSMLTCVALVHSFSLLNFNPLPDRIIIYVVILHCWTFQPFPLFCQYCHPWTCSSWESSYLGSRTTEYKQIHISNFTRCEIVFQGGCSNLYSYQHSIKLAAYSQPQEHLVLLNLKLICSRVAKFTPQSAAGRQSLWNFEFTF